MELIEMLEALSQTHGPSGDEGGVRAKIQALAQPFADEVIPDTLGNLIVHKKGEGPKVMFAAHMDSIGFIVTHMEKEGFLRVGRLGGISPKEAAYTTVRFKNGVRGVFVPEEKADFGKLKMDEDKFREALQKDPNLVKDVLGGQFGMAERAGEKATTILDMSVNEIMDKEEVSDTYTGSNSSSSSSGSTSSASSKSAMSDSFRQFATFAKSGAYNLSNYYAVSMLNILV